jgi:hypothetical protein
MGRQHSSAMQPAATEQNSRMQRVSQLRVGNYRRVVQISLTVLLLILPRLARRAGAGDGVLAAGRLAYSGASAGQAFLPVLSCVNGYNQAPSGEDRRARRRAKPKKQVLVHANLRNPGEKVLVKG